METLTQQRLVIKTDVLQDIVSKAVKVCSFVDSFVATGLLEIKAAEGKVTVITTDNINIINLQAKVEPDNNLHAVVNAKLFSALISKLTTPITEITLQDGKVVVKANGKYDIPVVSEQDGSAVNLPSFEFDTTVDSILVSNNMLRSIITMNKACKAEMKEIPAYFNYYMDSERVLTTDTFKVCNNPIKVFNNPVCLPPNLVELISLVADDNGVKVQENSNSVLFTSTLGSLYGRKATAEDLEAYAVQDILQALNESFNWSCVLNKTLLINALDRVCLFTEGIDNNAVNLTFSADSVKITTKRDNTNEVIKYLQPSNCDTPFTILLDAVFLKNQLNSFPKEDITIKFGNESGVELVCDNITQLSSSLGDEE